MAKIDLKAYNKVYYVSNTGNDEEGTGSVSSPFASVSHAIDNASDGDCIFIRKGYYKLKPMHESSYAQVGIFDRGKKLDIIGEGDGTILEYYGADSTARDGNLIGLSNAESRIVRVKFIFHPGKSSNYSNAIVKWSRGQILNCFIHVKGNRAASYSYYNDAPLNSPIFKNCIFYHDLKKVDNDYSGRPTYINCLFNAAPKNGVKDSCFTKEFDPENISELLNDVDLIDKGIGLDYDGSPADIGVFGGDYPWSKGYLSLFLSDDGRHSSYDFNSNSWVQIGFEPSEEDYIEHGILDTYLNSLGKEKLLKLPNLESNFPKVRTYRPNRQ